MEKQHIVRTFCFTLLMIFTTGFINAQTCSELISYRDATLFQDYDAALKRSINATTATIDFQKIKTDLLDDTKWVSSDWSLMVGMIGATCKTTADLTNNLLKFTPQGQVVGLGTSNADLLYNTLKVGGDIKKLISNGSEKFVAEKIVAKAGPIGQAVLTIKNFGENIATITNLPEDHTQLKKDLKEALENLEKEIKSLDSTISDENTKITLINEYKNGIDRYLRDECGKKQANSAVFKTPAISYKITGNNGYCTFKFKLQGIQIISQFDKTTRTFLSFTVKLKRSSSTAECVNIQARNGKELNTTLKMENQSRSRDKTTVFLPAEPGSPTKISAVFVGKLEGNLITGTITFNHADWTSAQNVVLTLTP